MMTNIIDQMRDYAVPEDKDITALEIVELMTAYDETGDLFDLIGTAFKYGMYKANC